jgi:dTDP-glucose 4,6-dehydratase
LVEGIYKLQVSDLSGPVNMGGTEEISILDFAQLVKRLCNSRSEIVFRELPQDDPVRRKPDISKARKLLNWEPKVSLEEGLKETIDWFKANVGSSNS